jgi:hypothetical protein
VFPDLIFRIGFHQPGIKRYHKEPDMIFCAGSRRPSKRNNEISLSLEDPHV